MGRAAEATHTAFRVQLQRVFAFDVLKIRSGGCHPSSTALCRAVIRAVEVRCVFVIRDASAERVQCSNRSLRADSVMAGAPWAQHRNAEAQSVEDDRGDHQYDCGVSLIRIIRLQKDTFLHTDRANELR